MKKRASMKMYSHYLFDWGDTLMIDFPSENGAMSTWSHVETVPGAEKLLRTLSGVARCHLATNASASSEHEIRKALDRVHLDNYLTGIFCFQSLGIEKPAPAFFNHILKALSVEKHEIVMVGDHLEKDIQGALDFGIDAIWLNTAKQPVPKGIISVSCLAEMLP